MTSRKIISTQSSPSPISTDSHAAAEGRKAKNDAGNDQAFANGRVGPSRSKSLAIRPVPRRGLSREEAAMYIGVSTGKFDELVRTGRMPGPKRIDGRKVWDVHGLDAAFDELPSESNSWGDV